MSPRRVHKLFAVALIFSVLIHAILLMLIGSAIREARWQAEVARVRTLPKLMPVELSLGIDAPTPPSETWIGYDKEIPQKAQPAEVEQAAFTDEPVAAAPPPPSPAPPVNEPIDPTPPQPPPAEPIVQQAPETAPPMPALPVEVESPTPAPPAMPELEETPQADLPVPEPAESERLESPNATELSEWFDEAREMLEQAERDAKAQAEAASQPAQPTLSSPPTDAPAQPEQAIARKADPSAPSTGAQSDKESDPSSIVEVPRDQWELGRPIAAHGLELKPKRPHFTVLMMMTSAPCNPSCEIIFDKTGVAAKARLLSGSCDSRVDDAILNSLYGWRASGEPLAKLAEGQTITVGIKLILTRRTK